MAIIGQLPLLPSVPDIIVTTAQQFRDAIAHAGAGQPVPGYDPPIFLVGDAKIAINANILALGSTNSDTVIIDKPVTIYPLAGYGEFESNPYGDGHQYARRFQRTCTITGFLKITANAKIYGVARTLDGSVYPPQSTRTPFAYTTWQDMGVASNSALDTIEGNAAPDIQGCEYYIGSDTSHTPFNPTLRLPDMKSPRLWMFNDSSESIAEVVRVTAATTTGQATWVVTSIDIGVSPLAPGQYVSGAGIPLHTSIISAPQGGGVGEYTLSAAATSSQSSSFNVGPYDIYSGSGSLSDPLPGWGDPDWIPYNRYRDMPTAIDTKGSVAWTGSGVMIRNNYIHDVGSGAKFLAKGTGLQHVDILDNEFSRIYIDTIHINFVKTAKIVPRIGRNIFQAPLANALDARNPHGDAQQSFGSDDTGTTGMYVQAHFKSFSNLIFAANTDRGTMQSHYWQMSSGHFKIVSGEQSRYMLVGGAIHNDVALSMNKLMNGDAFSNMLLRNSIGITQELNRPNYLRQMQSADSGGGWSTAYYLTRGLAVNSSNIVEVADSLFQIENSIFEGYAVSDKGFKASYRQSNSNVDFPSVFNGDGSINTTPRPQTVATFVNLNREITTANQAFLAIRQLKPAAQTMGVEFATLSDMLSASEPDVVRYGFLTQYEVVPFSIVESNPAYVHGILGTSRTVTVSQNMLNMLLWSQEFANSAWATSKTTIADDVALAPDGIMTAAQLTANATSSNSFITQTVSATAGQTYTFSFYIKAVSPAGATLNIQLIKGSNNVSFSTQSVTASTGWTRVSVTGIVPSGETQIKVRIGGNSSFAFGETIYVWGAQLQPGSIVTPYILTTSVAAFGVQWRTLDAYEIVTQANPTPWQSTSGSIQSGQLLQLRATTGGDHLTRYDFPVTVDNVTETFSLYTGPTGYFPTADNQGTAWSRASAPTGTTQYAKLLIATRIRVDSVSANNRVIAGDGASRFRIQIKDNPSGAWNILVKGSQICNAIFPQNIDTTAWHTLIFAIDLTATAPREIARLVVDYDMIDLDPTLGNFNVGGQERFTWSQLMSSGLGLFNTYSGGTGIADGAMQFFWMKAYRNVDALPDITDLNIINAFTKDGIDPVNGSSYGTYPGGVQYFTQPDIFYQAPVGVAGGGDANSWNATGGIPNLGNTPLPATKAGPLIRQAGTYA